MGMIQSGPKSKLSAESQKKIKEHEMSLNKVPKANEAFCLDMYKYAAPAKASQNGDLFSGLNRTVKVKKWIRLDKRYIF